MRNSWLVGKDADATCRSNMSPPSEAVPSLDKKLPHLAKELQFNMLLSRKDVEMILSQEGSIPDIQAAFKHPARQKYGNGAIDEYLVPSMLLNGYVEQNQPKLDTGTLSMSFDPNKPSALLPATCKCLGQFSGGGHPWEYDASLLCFLKREIKVDQFFLRKVGLAGDGESEKLNGMIADPTQTLRDWPSKCAALQERFKNKAEAAEPCPCSCN
jgi:hypothetical protein